MRHASTESQGFITRLESLRGVAALFVAFYHVGLWLFPENPTGLARIYLVISNGMGCVIAFFVISGFVLTRSLERHGGLSAANFLASRVFRLFPAIIAVVAFCKILELAGLRPTVASYNYTNVLLNMLVVHIDIDPVMWSMQVELVATPLILTSVMLYRRVGVRPILWILIVLFALSWIGPYRDLLGPKSNLSSIYAFVVGVLLHFVGRKWVDLIAARWVPLVALAAVLIFCAFGGPKVTGWSILLQAFSAAALIALVVWVPDAGIFRLLDHPIVRFYGRISYSFYLLHFLVGVAVVSSAGEIALWSQNAGHPLAVSAFGVALVTILIVTLPAYLCWRFVELPGVQIGRMLLARTKPSAMQT